MSHEEPNFYPIILENVLYRLERSFSLCVTQAKVMLCLSSYFDVLDLM